MSDNYARRLNLAFVIFSLVILASIFFSVTLWIGKSLGYDEATREGIRHTNHLPVACTAPLTQWKCNDQELKEYRHACASRIRMGLVRE